MNFSGKLGKVLLSAFILCSPFLIQAQFTNSQPAVELTLDNYLQEVLQQNESVQAQMLEAEASRHKWRGELGAFEPNLEASITREANKRTNDTQQAASQGGQSFFSERNTIYDGGIEDLLPTGGKIRLGATMSDLGNNVNPAPFFFSSTNNIFIKQYQTFVGATFTQPLLKGGGFTAGLAASRLASLDSDIAFQQYRQKLMLTIYQAEGAYWNLYFAQQQVHFFDQSVSVAQEVLSDAQQKMKVGQGAQLDVMEAQSALALRNTKRNDAVQNFYDALGHVQMLTGRAPDFERAGTENPAFRAVDDPRTTNAPPTYQDSFVQVYLLNPDYLIQQKKFDQERVRLGYAKNQLFPELDLKAAYGFNGLGATPHDSWDVAASQNFPSWSVGLELTIPLAGNIKGRNLYKAAKLEWNEAYMNLQYIQSQIGGSLSMAIQKARAWQTSIESYQTVVDYNKELLQTELARLKAGTVEAQKVLDTEAELLDSEQDLAGALTQYRRALLEIELNDGAILKNRGIDITREQLRRQTEQWLYRQEDASDEFLHPHNANDFSPVPPPAAANANAIMTPSPSP